MSTEETPRWSSHFASIRMSSEDDTWTTPRSIFDPLHEEFEFQLDAAALSSSALCPLWYGPDHQDPLKRDALTASWSDDVPERERERERAVWLNPPYGGKMAHWLEKANEEASKGLIVACLIPAYTHRIYFHKFAIQHEIRFYKGGLKFGDSKNAAPFPSCLVVMRKEANPMSKWVSQ